MVAALCQQSAVSIDWLNDAHGLNLSVIDSFLYPGHSAYRMHGTPSKTGQELIGALSSRAEALEISVITDAQVTDLFAGPGSEIKGVRFHRPDNSEETLGCKAIILACNGYGGNPEMVAELIPDMKDALYFGHVGNRGSDRLGPGIGCGHDRSWRLPRPRLRCPSTWYPGLLGADDGGRHPGKQRRTSVFQRA